MQIGRLRMRLMRQSDATDAYTTIGVVQVLERRSDNQVLLSKSYIPPMLHSGADATLGGYVRELQGCYTTAARHSRDDCRKWVAVAFRKLPTSYCCKR